jgi:hypothetical protein
MKLRIGALRWLLCVARSGQLCIEAETRPGGWSSQAAMEFAGGVER